MTRPRIADDDDARGIVLALPIGLLLWAAIVVIVRRVVG